MTVCFACNKELKFKARMAPEHNVDSYGKPATARTKCCNTLMRLVPIRSIRYEMVEDEGQVDDWGYGLS